MGEVSVAVPTGETPADDTTRTVTQDERTDSASDNVERRPRRSAAPFVSGIALVIAFLAMLMAIAAGNFDKSGGTSMMPLASRVAQLEADTTGSVAISDVRRVVAEYVQPLRTRVSRLEKDDRVSVQRDNAPAADPTEPETETRSRVFLDSNGAPLRLATVMAALDREGFRFENSPLTDGTQRYIALKHTTVVELYPESGTPHLYRIDIVGIASGDDQAANLVIVQAFRAAFNAVAPWGYAWWEENVESLIASAERSVENKSARTKFLDGVMAVIRVNAILPSYSLELRGGAPQ